MRRFFREISPHFVLIVTIGILLSIFAFLPNSFGSIGAKEIFAQGDEIDSVFATKSHNSANDVSRKPLWETDWSHALDILTTLLLASILGGLVSYRRRGGSAQMDLTEAHIILSASAALMMMIIGSQIARAFGLMGAASIVRYRYSLKSPKEASSLVVALGIGMACGVGLYPLAIISSLFIMVVLNLFEHIPPSVKKAVFPPSWTWNLRVRTADPEKALALIKEFLSKADIDYKIKEMVGGKGPAGDQTDIEIEIYGHIDRNSLGEQLTSCGAIRVRWRQEKSDNYIDMEME